MKEEGRRGLLDLTIRRLKAGERVRGAKSLEIIRGESSSQRRADQIKLGARIQECANRAGRERRSKLEIEVHKRHGMR